MIRQIVSGGQTGVDRAALDFAIEQNIPHRGWCPKGRLAEDGMIDGRYLLQETSTEQYAERTKKNVQDSDGTVILTISPILIGGSALTAEFARKQGKPWIHVSAERREPAADVLRFLERHHIAVLNVAGSRGSEEPGAYDFVQKVLTQVFRQRDFKPAR